MSAELFKLCDPEAYFDKFIAQDIFPDGRSIGNFPPIYFKNGSYGGVGSSLVRQGDVTVSCTVKAAVSLVNDGPLLTAEFENKADLKEVSIILAYVEPFQKSVVEVLNILNELFSTEVLISRSSLLCRGTEESVPLTWKLTVHIRVLNSSGSLVDTVIAAVSYALSNIELPYVKLAHAKDDEAPIEKNEITVLPEKYSLELREVAVCSTFALYETTSLKEQKSVILCDPPTDMLRFCKTKCVVVAGENKILNFTLNGSIDDSILLNTIFELAMGRHSAVAKSIKS